jgi:hypothetical protein
LHAYRSPRPSLVIVCAPTPARPGLNIETVDEPHGGPFSGSHARYILREPIELIGADCQRLAA